MATGNAVQFAYISAGGSLPPSYPDRDTIYFLEETKEIRVGSQTLANVDTGAIHMDTLLEVLAAYNVKSVNITGDEEGDNISNVVFNESTGQLKFTKSKLPVLSKGTTPQPAERTLTPGGSFTVLTDESVSGHTITDAKTTFTLPKQFSTMLVSKGEGSNLVFTLSYSDGSTETVTFAGLGTAAFAATSDFATSAQGAKADAAMPRSEAMPKVSGTATDATITLHADPVNAMDAATKQYVDAHAGGGGDVPSTRQIAAGYGLEGGGTLAADVTIAHGTKFTEDKTITFDGLNVPQTVSYDKAGHISSITSRDITSTVNGLITTVTNPISAAVDSVTTDLANNYYKKTETYSKSETYSKNEVYTKGETDQQIDTKVAALAATIPDLVEDALDDRVTTDAEYEEMYHDVFG